MKFIETNSKYSLGKLSSKKHYKLILFFQGEEPKDFQTHFAPHISSKSYTGEAGQIFTDEAHLSLFYCLGPKDKFVFRKAIQTFFSIGEKLSKFQDFGLEIHIPSSLTKVVSAEKLLYQIIITLEISFFPINFLNKTYKEKFPKPGEISFLLEDTSLDSIAKHTISKAKEVAKHVNGVRHIAHLPANHFTPEEFVSRSKEIAKMYKLGIKIWDEPQLRKGGFGGILSVCEGSDKKPKMIILEYKPKNATTKLALVGKGLTFDSGGISIKPAAEMHEMKYDMCGAATAIHAIGAIASQKLPIHVIAAIGVAENMPDAAATKPGDVYTAYNGLTVEVQNTDAEGRLVLGDVLAYVNETYKPKYCIDLATLTGAVIIALGNEAAGMMTNSSKLKDLLLNASQDSEERLWELPLWAEFGDELKSDIADIRNITGGRGAGTISAAQFLSRFVPEGVEWAHLDIAGTAWRKGFSGIQPNGVTGYGVRLLLDFAEKASAKN
jgi:leucyl aminopeptidase